MGFRSNFFNPSREHPTDNVGIVVVRRRGHVAGARVQRPRQDAAHEHASESARGLQRSRAALAQGDPLGAADRRQAEEEQRVEADDDDADIVGRVLSRQVKTTVPTN